MNKFFKKTIKKTNLNMIQKVFKWSITKIIKKISVLVIVKMFSIYLQSIIENIP